MRDEDRNVAISKGGADGRQSTDAVDGTCDRAIRAAYLAHTFPKQPDREMAGDKPGSMVNADPDIGEGEQPVEAVNGEPKEDQDESPVA